jgi:hypothetical protein
LRSKQASGRSASKHRHAFTPNWECDIICPIIYKNDNQRYNLFDFVEDLKSDGWKIRRITVNADRLGFLVNISINSSLEEITIYALLKRLINEPF